MGVGHRESFYGRVLCKEQGFRDVMENIIYIILKVIDYRCSPVKPSI